ncbi:hypothetical protein AVEN_275748-1 [Araneus ventricosus]|uniref:Uncharacterized protein n=1 Tax=Araneus ventricosus TaxID=182803 RepID=A0A4Y2HNL7_ARAVE|nr:hypothetical protein AVEN_275748-1 [Araneus ventricosus]
MGTTPAERLLTHGVRFIIHQARMHAGSSVESGLKPGTLQSGSRGLTTRAKRSSFCIMEIDINKLNILLFRPNFNCYKLSFNLTVVSSNLQIDFLPTSNRATALKFSTVAVVGFR